MPKFSMLGKMLGDEIIGTPRKAEVEKVFGEAGWIPPDRSDPLEA